MSEPSSRCVGRVCVRGDRQGEECVVIWARWALRCLRCIELVKAMRMMYRGKKDRDGLRMRGRKDGRRVAREEKKQTANDYSVFFLLSLSLSLPS